MKKHLFTILSAFITGLTLAQTIPNAGFESWNVTSFENPSVFYTSNMKGINGTGATINVTKTTDAFSGNYAIRVSTNLVGTDTAFAFAAIGDPGKTPAQGGLPYTQKPLGISLHYKSNIVAGDSAMIIVQFKKSGAAIGNYFYKIGTTQTSYTIFNKTFTPALPVNPDSVVFAFASSNVFAGVAKPGNFLQIDSVNFTGVAFQPASFNGSFENWQTVTATKLNNWTTEDNATRTTDNYNGTYALELQTSSTSFGGSGNRTGFAMTGKWPLTGGNPYGGTPYSTKIDTLVFFYKYIPSNGDTGQVYITFSKNGVGFNSQGRDFIGFTPTYSMMQIPFNLGTAPDTMRISFQSSRMWPPPNKYIGSDLKIDNIYLKSQKLPVSSFSFAPNIGCTGVPVQLTDLSYNGAPSNWNWIMPGGTPNSSTAQNPTVTYVTPGTYTISLLTSNVFGSSAMVSKTITVSALPVVSVNSATICNGNSITLSASGANTYTWSNGSTGSVIVPTPTVTTNYTVTGGASGCFSSAVANVFINVPQTPDICLVTTDSLSRNNIVYWDKTGISGVDSFIVYREVTTGIYKRIGSQHYSVLSQFTDTMRSIGPANGNPMVGSYRYKLQTRDACGNFSALSPYHNTVYFTNPSAGLFTWNLYSVEGQVTPVTNFQLMRDSINNGNYKAIGSVAGTQITLSDAAFASYPNGNWRVDALGFNCNVTQKVMNPNLIRQKSHSNSSKTTAIGIKELYSANNLFSIYPNPASGTVNIKSNITERSTIKLYDLTGKVIMQTIYLGGTQNINLAGIAQGMYFIEMNNSRKILVVE